MMITPWDINAVVLHHLLRFFHAAREAISQWREPAGEDSELLGSLLTLSGNMLWARSSFEAEDRRQEQAMAYGGAFIGTMAEKVLRAADHSREAAEAALSALERRIFAVYDDLLCRLVKRLESEGLAQGTPGQINEAIWCYLFPGIPFGVSQRELFAACQTLVLP